MTAAALAWPRHHANGRTNQKVRRDSRPLGAEVGWFIPIDKGLAALIMQAARRLFFATMKPGARRRKKRWGELHPTDLQLLDELIFRFMDWRSGRLDPSYDQLEAATGRARQTIADGLARLVKAGLLERMRRFELVAGDDGLPEVRQITNAYRVKLPERLKALFQTRWFPQPEDDEVRRGLAAKRAREMAADESGLGRALDALERGVSYRESRNKGDSPVRSIPKGGSAG